MTNAKLVSSALLNKFGSIDAAAKAEFTGWLSDSGLICAVTSF